MSGRVPSRKVMERAYVTDRVRHTKLTAGQAREEFKAGIAVIEREAAARARWEALIEVVQAHRNLHQTYGSTAVCHGGIGGQALTSHCAEICYNADAHETEMRAWQALEVEVWNVPYGETRTGYIEESHGWHRVPGSAKSGRELKL